MNEDLRRLIGERINKLLSDSKKTQKELAAVLSVTENTISYYVNGKRTPNIEQLIVIAQYFETTTDYLLGRTENKTVDIELQAISEFTGLHEKSIELLHYFVKECKTDQESDYRFNKLSIDFINYLFTEYSRSGKCEDFTDLLDLVYLYSSLKNNNDDYKFRDYSDEEMKEKIEYGISYEIQRIFGGFVKGFCKNNKKSD